MCIASIQQKVYVMELNNLRNGKRSSLQIQLEIYVGSDGLMRCRGKLDKSDLAKGARRPILLPKTKGIHVWLLRKYKRIICIQEFYRHLQEFAQIIGYLKVVLW